MVAGVLTSAVTAMMLAAVGTGGTSGTTGGGTGDDSVEVRAEARFAPPKAFVPSSALTYNQELVPAGSWIQVTQRSDQRGTRVSLRVKGMEPNYKYGVHVHQKPCGADPAAAGGHYQNKPSTDPGDVNPANEVWLDFTARRDGSGASSAYHDWGFRRGEAASVVLHREQGGAGERLACFSVPFAPQPEK
ncbi:superoxide dismutase family protein [Streptomyces sp. G45]|uniref:superoxide dismutase family protein n=1 Tax=Streptomyces sp. G45 TaxID=3406627 RepID=UPI003C218E25